MKNQHQDLKILSILSKTQNKKLLLSFGILFSLLLIPQISFAEVSIPTDEYIGYYDSNGIYTVVGNVKNQLDYAIIPTLSVSVQDGSKVFSKTITHVPLASGAEIPFKIKFYEVSGDTPSLLPVQLSFEKTEKDLIPISVIYDQTLVTHDDGHLTGRIQNTGEETIYNPKIFAVIHGYEKVLDIAQNLEYIEKIDPGEIVDFSMYPDPSVTEDVFYYSCFAPVDTTVVPITVKKHGEDFDFRYDSGAWYSAAKFDEEGTTLSIRGYNSYPLKTYANFEFAPISGFEKFSVTLNDEPVQFIQSIDEMGFWHVAFEVEPTSQGILKISGFEKGLPPESSQIPQWIRINADWWSSDQISDDEFLEGIIFLAEKEIISVSLSDETFDSQWKLPQWIKNPADWWSSDQISDDEFLKLIENLVKQKIILI